MAILQLHQFLCRSDNYGVLVHDAKSGTTISVDTPGESAVRNALLQRGWKLTHIFNTHHHFDHVEGNAGLKSDFGCKIIGPGLEADKITDLDEGVGDGDEFSIGDIKIRVIATPGHTLGEVSFHFPDNNIVFTGDTLFALGCGRVFEGTPEMMWQSLEKLAALPRETIVYCGHEYTLANARFAVTVDPENPVLLQRLEKITQLRAENQPTLPTTIGEELDTNPFLRPADPAIRTNLGMEAATNAEVFAEIRARKDAA